MSLCGVEVYLVYLVSTARIQRVGALFASRSTLCLQDRLADLTSEVNRVILKRNAPMFGEKIGSVNVDDFFKSFIKEMKITILANFF